MLAIKSRIQFLVKLYGGVIPVFSILVLASVISYFLFIENQVLASFIPIFTIHYTRKDILLLKIVYAEEYNKILFFEYLFVFLLYVIIAIFVNDLLLIYAPVLFLLATGILFFILPKLEKSRIVAYATVSSIININDFIWRSAVRKAGVKILVLYIIFIPLILLVKHYYLYPVFLCLMMLLFNTFYSHNIPFFYIDVIDKSRAKSIWIIYKRNIGSFFRIMTIPITVQVYTVFYNHTCDVVYFVLSMVACCVLIFQFLCTDIYAYNYKKSIHLMQLVNGFSVVAVLFPPLAFLSILLSHKLFNKLANG